MFRLKWPTHPRWSLIASVGSLSVLVIIISALGWLQPLEWFALDQFFRLRKSQSIDPRILIVTIDEPDINYVGDWPLPDDTLAELLLKVSAADPRGIGLDMYRNLPVGQGHADLTKVFENTPILVGVEKVVGQPIGPPPGVDPERQVGMSDVVVDNDGRVRRALLLVITDDGEYKYGLATQLAFNALEQEQIYPSYVDEKRLQLGKATLRRFQKNDGGYANADDGGSQMLINFPAGNTWFETVSMTAVLEGKVPSEQIKNRIVLIGATAISLNDFFYTPMSRVEEMPGVFVHAHIVSQLMGAAVDGRTLLHGVQPWGKWLWLVTSTFGAGLVFYVFIQQGKSYRRQNFLTIIWLVPCVGTSIIVLTYGLFTLGLWVPVVAPVLSASLLAVLLVLQQNQKLQGLAAFDELTQIPNRRSFDQFLQELITHQKSFTLVLCDVDYFKRYNDTYGHQDGDTCLRAIAQVLKQGVRQSDLAARYGGEEFALVIKGPSATVATEILTRIQAQLAELKILHEASDVSTYVTLSFGVAVVEELKNTTPKALIERADGALYKAKRKGRNQFFVSDVV
ncbi:MAG: CHASE2 domain-containing protein [Cyanobacteria bacterium P01_F01_bin.53]